LNALQRVPLGCFVSQDAEENQGVSQITGSLNFGDGNHAAKPRVLDVADQELADFLAQ
jgi:hypothetical protein